MQEDVKTSFQYQYVIPYLQRFLRAPSWQPASWLRRPRVFHFNFVHSGLEETPEGEEEASALWVSVTVALGRLRQLWAPRDVEVGLGLGRPGLNSCLSGSNALQGCFFIGFRMDFFSGFGFVFSAKRFPLGFDGLCIKVCLKSQDSALVQMQIW